MSQVDPNVRGVDGEAGRAGGSARDEYQRRKAAGTARLKGQFGSRLGGALLVLTNEPQSTRAWARGAEGEREVARELSGIDGVRLLHDRRVPGMRANIDHIVIGPAGVFVIDAKHYRGTIRVRDVGGPFKRDERLFVGRRDCSKLADAMAWQVRAVADALAPVAGAQSIPIVPVLCFVNGEWPLLGAPRPFRGVRLESTRSLRQLVTATVAVPTSVLDVLTNALANRLRERA